MEAKSTVMTTKQMVECSHNPVQELRLKAICEKQAEISFKAGMKHGIWLFAWWKDGVQYVGTCGGTLKEVYKELGLDT